MISSIFGRAPSLPASEIPLLGSRPPAAFEEALRRHRNSDLSALIALTQNPDSIAPAIRPGEVRRGEYLSIPPLPFPFFFES